MSSSVKKDLSPGISTEHISGDEENFKAIDTVHGGEEGNSKALDNVHGDEAIKVLAAYDGDQTWTPEEEKKLRRKIDRKLLPVLCVTYAFLYADKVLLGQAVWPSLKFQPP